MQEMNFPEAQNCFQKLLELRPDYPPAHANYARLLSRQEQFPTAVGHLQRAIELKPDYARAHLNLADIYAQLRQYDQAIAAYQKTIQLCQASSLAAERRSTRIKALSRLSAVYAEIGRFALAATAAEQAFDLARRYELSHLAEEVEPRLKRYRRRAGKE